MGIPGLLTALKSVTYPVHISQYNGLTVGVDAYCWLHRGTFSCSTELCTNSDTDKYVTFCMRRVSLLRHHGAKPIMVFDGASLPVKSGKHFERRRQRETSMVKGQEALAAGESGAAAHHFAKATAVTHDMAYAFIKELKRAGVEIMVAPYEADAQLAHLSRTGAIDVVITEDSDCLPYGCKKVMFKMDNEGNGQEIQLRNLAANKPLSLCNWKNSMFLDLCLLVGCDYITASIKGLGIATAHKLVYRHRKLDKIINAVEKTKLVVPEDYWSQYKRARLTFRHHIVYDPQTKNTIHLMPLGDSAREMEDLDFLGAHLPQLVAQGVASGCLNPKTHKVFEGTASTAISASVPLSPSQVDEERDNSLTVSCAGATAERHESLIKETATAFERPTTPGSGATSRSTQGSISEVERLGHASSPLPCRSRVLIERPFCAERTALAELSFPVDERPHHLPVSWSTASIASATSSSSWSRQSEAQAQGLEPKQRDHFGGNVVSSLPGMYREDRQDLEQVCEDRLSRAPAIAESPPESSDGRKLRLSAGLNLSRIRENASVPAPGDFSSLRATSSRECLSGSSNGASSLSNVAMATALFPLSLQARLREDIPRFDIFDDLRPRHWQEEPSGSGGPVSRRIWDMGSSVNQSNCWGESRADGSRQPLWGEDHGEPSQGLPQETSGVQHNVCTVQSQPRPTLFAERRRPGDTGGERESKEVANLFGWTCYKPTATASTMPKPGQAELEARQADERGVNGEDIRGFSHEFSNAGEAETREGTESFSIGESKYVPASAHNFHSTQVSPGLETLQRRKRRLGMAPGALQGTTNASQEELKLDRAPPAGGQNLNVDGSAASGTPPNGSWMRQADDHSQRKQHSVPRAPVRGLATTDSKDKSRGLQFCTRVCGSESADDTRCSSEASTHTRHMEGLLLERDRQEQTGPSRTYSEASRHWTVPLAVAKRGQTDLPLFRLTGEHEGSFHARVAGGGSAPRMKKRNRGVDFWDARLMR